MKRLSTVLVVAAALGAAASPAWSQLPVSGAVLHLDASDPLGTGALPTDGAAVGSWADIAPTGIANNATEAVTANQPIFRAGAVNGLPGIEFAYGTTVSPCLTVENWASTLTSGATGFAVANTTSYTWRQGSLWRFGTPGDGGTNYSFGTEAVHDSFGLQQRATNAITHGGMGLAIYEVTLTDNGDGTGVHQAWYNGLPGAANTGDLAWTDTPAIGNKASGAFNMLHGQIGEVVIYDHVLSGADRNAVGEYLSQKYGIQRSQGVAVQQDADYLAYSTSQSSMIRGFDSPWDYSWRPVDTGTETETGGAIEAYDDTARSGTRMRTHLQFTDTGTYYAYFRCRTNDTDGGGDPYNNDAFRGTETNETDPSKPAFGAFTYYDYQFVRNDQEFQWYKVPAAGGAPDASKVYIDTDDVGVVYPWELTASNPGPMVDTVIWHTSDSLTDEELDAIAASLVPPDCLMGDANGDGEVGIADLSALADNYGKTDASWKDGDFNGDDVVGIADLSALADHYGDTGDPCTPASVPEPATMLLLIGGAVVMAARRR